VEVLRGLELVQSEQQHVLLAVRLQPARKLQRVQATRHERVRAVVDTDALAHHLRVELVKVHVRVHAEP